MNEHLSRRNKDAMLKMLGQAILEVKSELSEFRDSLGENAHSRYNLIREETRENMLMVMDYHISRGWVPLGGIAIQTENKNNGKNFYLQAIWLPKVPEIDPLVMQSEDKIDE